MTQPSPQLFFGAIGGYQTAATVRGGIDLEIFTHIDDGKITSVELAKATGCSERGIRILCDALLATGFLTKQNFQYGLTPDSKLFLSKKSPAYMGGVTEFMGSPELVSAFQNVAENVRRGGTTMPAGGTVSHDNPVWVKFARAMLPMMMMPATNAARLAKCSGATKVLDVAAGHGIFGVQFALQYPEAQVTAMDWPNVLNVAQETAQKFGVAKRFQTLPGDAFKLDWGSNAYDVVLLPNFLHHFDLEQNHMLLKKAHAALKPAGKAITIEFVPNRERTMGPLTFALTMLVTTERGDAYTYEEYKEMFARAGFASTEIGEEDPQTILISAK